MLWADEQESDFKLSRARYGIPLQVVDIENVECIDGKEKNGMKEILLIIL